MPVRASVARHVALRFAALHAAATTAAPARRPGMTADVLQALARPRRRARAHLGAAWLVLQRYAAGRAAAPAHHACGGVARRPARARGRGGGRRAHGSCSASPPAASTRCTRMPKALPEPAHAGRSPSPRMLARARGEPRAPDAAARATTRRIARGSCRSVAVAALALARRRARAGGDCPPVTSTPGPGGSQTLFAAACRRCCCSRRSRSCRRCC